MLQIIKHRNYWFLLSALIILAGILAIIFGGLKLGLDFTGGTLMEISFNKQRPPIQELQDNLKALDLRISTIQPAGEKDYVLKMKNIDNEKRQEILTKLKKEYKNIEEKRFESIGPTIGQELKRKAVFAIIFVIILIILYIAYAFRKVSKKISSWKMGICTIVALFHDLLVVIGAFAILGKIIGVEIDSLFVTALLTVLGYSVHDTIIVFDRIRYNLIKFPDITFEKTVNNSINQTMTRSINTTTTTLLVLFTLYLFGGGTISWFIFALILGFITGTYSTIFVASPLLVKWEKRSKK
ncbi:MAG: protein translocase subunit SecF [Patescibacteria group bacterium]